VSRKSRASQELVRCEEQRAQLKVLQAKIGELEERLSWSVPGAELMQSTLDDLRCQKQAEARALHHRAVEALEKDGPEGPGGRYLESRGIPFALAKRYRLGYAGPGQWPGGGPARLVVPHTTPPGDIVNLYGRAINEADQFLRHRNLFGTKGVFNAAVMSGPLAYITEGAFDALALLAAGFPALAVFGLRGLRWEWLRARRLVVCLDADEPGRREASALLVQAVARGYETWRADPRAYGGCKDVAEAHRRGCLNVEALRLAGGITDTKEERE